MAILNVPNEAALKTVLIGTETTPGTAVTPTGRLLLDFTGSPGIGDVRANEDATGSYDRTATVRRSRADASGTLGGPLTYQELAILPKYALKGGVAGVSDSESTPGYTYTYSPSASADDIDTATVQFGVDGLPWVATGVRFDEINISGDATAQDDQWQVGGTPFIREVARLEDGDLEGTVTVASTDTVITVTDGAMTIDEHIGKYFFMDYGSHIGEVRQITDNDATTITLESALSSTPSGGEAFYVSAAFPTIADADYDPITMEGTNVYLDTYNSGASTLGTTLISDRVLSFNVTQRLNLAYKYRASGVIGRLGRGAREVTGQLRLEFDRWDEYVNLVNNTELSLRIEKTGPVIDSGAGTNHLARIDIERAVFAGWSDDVDTNNMTVTLAFRALQESPIWQITAKTNLAATP